MGAANVTAGGLTNYTLPTIDNLLCGDAQVQTASGYVAGAAIAERRTVGVVTSTGALVPHDPTAVDGSQVCVGAAVHAATNGQSGVSIYVAGQFNHDALTWHASLDTLVKRRAAVSGTAFFVGSITAT